jgi:F-box protein 9
VRYFLLASHSRFFPNGQVLSLLANEEKNPHEIIPLLKANLRMKGLFVGQWKLVGTTVHLSHLVDASTRFVFPVPETAQSGINSDDKRLSQGSNIDSSSITHRRGHGSNSSAQTDPAARYTFEMTLNLRSKPVGKWNKMDIQTYDSVNLESGDVHPVALKHERPFWFSKVRSYA